MSKLKNNSRRIDLSEIVASGIKTITFTSDGRVNILFTDGKILSGQYFEEITDAGTDLSGWDIKVRVDDEVYKNINDDMTKDLPHEETIKMYF